MADKKLIGVNLGGWLVLERWMTPSLFEGLAVQDEYGFMLQSAAADRIDTHRQTFITEADFRWLSEHGVNAVRLPVGYWLFGGEEPYAACTEYVDFAMTMAEKYGFQVLIDLHAAKGSQNGKDHSGQIGKAEWYSQEEYRQHTIEVLRGIAERYAASPALWGIELLNEPQMGIKEFFILRRFYQQAYATLTPILKPGTAIVFSDAFLPQLFSGAMRPVSGYPAVMDVHWYQFGRTNLHRYFSRLLRRPSVIKKYQQKQPIIIGEWSGMLSHKTLADINDDGQAVLQRRHIAYQQAAYTEALGWFYWNYKTEAPGVWNFKEQVESGHLLLSEGPMLH